MEQRTNHEQPPRTMEQRSSHAQPLNNEKGDGMKEPPNNHQTTVLESGVA
ncbi:putative ornithine decarboxylase [Sesbania bispinosa]|nr:putative ornithine decarboxylase [Sesbania bispinosa]